MLIALIKKAVGKQILVISSSADDKLLDDLHYFLPGAVIDFPSWETLPGEEITPSPDIVGKRLEVLHTLLHSKKTHVLLAPLQAVLQKLPSKKQLKPLSLEWKKGDAIPFTSLAKRLEELGYKRVPVVADKGEYGLRGGILDLFPPSASDPYRIEFFGDTIEEIRTFDPISQKSIAKEEKLLIPPASESALVGKGQNTETLLDYLGPDTLIIFNDLLAIEDRYVSLKNLPGAKSPLFLTIDAFLKQAAPLQHLFWTLQPLEALSSVQIEKKQGRAYYSGKAPLQPLTFDLFGAHFKTKRWHMPFVPISDYFSITENQASATSEEILYALGRHPNISLQFLSSTEAEQNALHERLKKNHTPLPKNTTFAIGYLSSGYVLPDANFALLPMAELTHRTRPRRQKWRSTYHSPASDFHELVPGDVVVHFHSGIAKYLGVEKRPNHVGVPTEFLLLEYAEGSKLFVPAAQSHLVSRYIGIQEATPVLSQLGSPRWQKTRTSAQQAIIGYADQLLRLHAERALHGGFIYPSDSEEMTLFESDFPFVETEDQIQAITAIKKDMQSEKAMDRLICGDVGYGKTEVAMRAAFKAVADGKKQVAVLVPTTVLAMQHYETFCERMANFPISIGVVSRFCSSKEIKETLRKVKEGEIDILVGTHRLISKDVCFKELGLIIIDEEQRFGVRAKEHLKTLKIGVDCLTLSATPIPRTLYLSLIGAREISVINTPPQDRLPIKSIIAGRDPTLIQNALLRELSRDGQAYFIHNRVESIFRVTEELQKLLPEAQIVTGHGQMSPEELDTVFHAFKSGAADILVATTIVENGIDIPNANTILIDRSDTFGLADLYQMRGRVGRWNRPAYAYFLVPSARELPELTARRLKAIAEASGFGAGMKIAMRDLEIRGAGDILGTQQSGQISTIGFHLYCKLLKRAVDALKNKSAPSFIETKMEFSFDASLPDTYIDAPSLRMEIYHRLGEASSLSEVDALLAELKDRFGPYPPQVLWLYHLTRLRLFASTHLFTLIKFENLTFTAERQSGKTTTRKTLAMPRTKNPAHLEEQVIAALKDAFDL
ncbi:MAG: transcription-repair coupling factor [Verrucomicrobia bacterium]|nr:transcription-repair coupling factor [Verrucomicrobiota bacterium]